MGHGPQADDRPRSATSPQTTADSFGIKLRIQILIRFLSPSTQPVEGLFNFYLWGKWLSCRSAKENLPLAFQKILPARY